MNVVLQAAAVWVAGMGSKETMVAAPVMVLAMDEVFGSGSWWKALRRSGWFYAGLAATGRYEQAIGHLRRAAELAPEAAAVRQNLGLALAETGYVEEGIRQIQEAQRLAPEDKIIAENLAKLMEMQRQKGSLERRGVNSQEDESGASREVK